MALVVARPSLFGDWEFVPDNFEENEENTWQRFENYGVFHCVAIIRRANSRSDLENAHHEYGFFVQLGKSRLGSVEWDLCALQLGTNAGSDCTLMAHESARGGPIEDFVILQQRCPSRSIREARGFDLWSTRYCAINSREELLSLGKRMLTLSPVGTIRRSAPAG